MEYSIYIESFCVSSTEDGCLLLTHEYLTIFVTLKCMYSNSLYYPLAYSTKQQKHYMF